MSIKGTDEAWEERKLGNDERYVAPYVDTNTRLAQQEYRIEQLEDELAELRRLAYHATASDDRLAQYELRAFLERSEKK